MIGKPGRCFLVFFGVLAAGAMGGRLASAQSSPTSDSAKTDAASAKAAFAAKFEEYKEAIREIESLQARFQTADAATRKKLNEAVTGQIAHTQSLVNAMVDAAIDAYRAAPNDDVQVTNVLIAVARYDVLGRQTGPGQSLSQGAPDKFYPTEGGDQYERAMPIVKLLIDGGAKDKSIYVLGFLCAYMLNDYDLADTYLKKARESGALEEVAMRAARDDREDREAGLYKGLEHLLESCIENLAAYREFWKKEAELRAAEAKADDLPRVKLTTSKGEIVVELFENESPQTVANFLTLVKQGFYNGSPFHRVLPKFMAQGGAKTDQGEGGPGYTIPCECYSTNYRRHFRGTLSMAHKGRDTGNSQFFITFIPTAHLNGRHTAFGRVIEGIEVLGDLQRRSPQHEQQMPPADKILKAEVVRDRGHKYEFQKLPSR